MPDAKLYSQAFFQLQHKLLRRFEKAQEEVKSLSASLSLAGAMAEPTQATLRRQVLTLFGLRPLRKITYIHEQPPRTVEVYDFENEKKVNELIRTPEKVIERAQIHNVGECLNTIADAAVRLLVDAVGHDRAEIPSRIWTLIKSDVPNRSWNGSDWQSLFVQALVSEYPEKFKVVETGVWEKVRQSEVALGLLGEQLQVPPGGHTPIGDDVPDGKGEVQNPRNIEDYRLMSKIIADFSDIVKDNKALDRVLNQHPEIRRHRPNRRRRAVHIVDWQNFADRERARQNPDSFDQDARGIEDRTRKIRAKKQRK